MARPSFRLTKYAIFYVGSGVAVGERTMLTAIAVDGTNGGDPLTIQEETTVRGDGAPRKTGMVDASLTMRIVDDQVAVRLRRWAASGIGIRALLLGPYGLQGVWDEDTVPLLETPPVAGRGADGEVLRLQVRKANPAICRCSSLFEDVTWNAGDGSAGSGSGSRILPIPGALAAASQYGAFALYAWDEAEYEDTTVYAYDLAGALLGSADGLTGLTLPAGTWTITVTGPSARKPRVTLAPPRTLGYFSGFELLTQGVTTGGWSYSQIETFGEATITTSSRTVTFEGDTYTINMGTLGPSGLMNLISRPTCTHALLGDEPYCIELDTVNPRTGDPQF